MGSNNPETRPVIKIGSTGRGMSIPAEFIPGIILN
jgi:ribose 5-phosphate isomerase RpiB